MCHLRMYALRGFHGLRGRVAFLVFGSPTVRICLFLMNEVKGSLAELWHTLLNSQREIFARMIVLQRSTLSFLTGSSESRVYL